MMNDTVSLPVAAAICRITVARFTRMFIDTRMISPSQDHYQVIVNLRNLSELLGREITCEEVLSANRALEKRRAYQRNWQKHWRHGRACTAKE